MKQKEDKKQALKKIEESLASVGKEARTEMQIALENKRVNAARLARKIKAGLDATNAAKYSKEGTVIQEENPDFAIQQKYIDMTLKIRGDYAPEKTEIEHKVITLNLTPEFIKGLKDSKAITTKEVTELKELKHMPIRE